MPNPYQDFRNLRRVFKAILLVALSLCTFAPSFARAQSSIERIQGSMVRVRVHGQNSSDLTINQYGTGFFLTPDGYIATAFHVVGKDKFTGELVDWKMEDGVPLRFFTIEYLGPNGDVVTYNGAVQMVDSASLVELDVAVLKIAGSSFPAARCSFDRLAVDTQVRGAGWRKGRSAIDTIVPGLVNAPDPADGERLRIVGMRVDDGHSGGAIFKTGTAVVSALVTSGRDGRLVPGSTETFVTPLHMLKERFPYNLCATGVPPPPPLEAFRDCEECPNMVVIPPGEFQMGSAPSTPFPDDASEPIRTVTISSSFAIGRTEITNQQWLECVRAGGCSIDAGGHIDLHTRYPIHFVNRQDALDFARWLSLKTGQNYRLPTEAEWEYAARGGRNSIFHWGDAMADDLAACWGCPGRGDTSVSRKAFPVGQFPQNGFKLYDMSGNVSELVEDCWFSNHQDAPSDGRARLYEGCSDRVVRGGSFLDPPMSLRLFVRRIYVGGSDRSESIGFRIARDLPDG